MRNILLKISLLLSIILSCAMGNCGYAQTNPTVKIVPTGNNHQVKNANEFVKLAKNSCAFDENDSPKKLAEIL